MVGATLVVVLCQGRRETCPYDLWVITRLLKFDNLTFDILPPFVLSSLVSGAPMRPEAESR
jgi:hypothetical protein